MLLRTVIFISSFMVYLQWLMVECWTFKRIAMIVKAKNYNSMIVVHNWILQHGYYLIYFHMKTWIQLTFSGNCEAAVVIVITPIIRTGLSPSWRGSAKPLCAETMELGTNNHSCEISATSEVIILYCFVIWYLPTI